MFTLLLVESYFYPLYQVIPIANTDGFPFTLLMLARLKSSPFPASLFALSKSLA